MWLFALLACGSEDPVQADIDFLTADRLEEATLRLTEVGPRIPGTPGEEAAAGEVEAMFRDGGLTATRAPFQWDVWMTGPATITVGDRVFSAEPIGPSRSVSNFQTALSSEGASGEAALWFSSDGGLFGQYLSSMFGGSSAMIRSTDVLDYDGGQLVEAGYGLSGNSLPAVAVDQETGLALAALAGEKVTFNIDTSIVPDHISYNVVAKVEGEIDVPVFVVGHYDSLHLSESAYDNALGVAAMTLFASQVQQGKKPRYDVYFIATSGLEQGLVGSQAWVEQNAALVDSGHLVLALDGLWSSEGPFFVEASDPEMRKRVVTAAQEEGIVDVVEEPSVRLGSDHAPFMGHGVPALICGRWEDRHYHTANDTVEYIDFEMAAAAMRSQWKILAEELEID